MTTDTHRTELPNCVFEWHPKKAQQVPPEPLTTLELVLLEKHHGSTNVNTDRAQAVKTYRANGCTLTEIAAYLRGKPGCGKRMIATDLAALSEAERKTRFENAMQQITL
jgi:hypothetical protein